MSEPEEKLHSEYGPSSLKHTAACRGWQSRGGSSEAAEKGNRIHYALEHANPSGLLDENEQSIYEELASMESNWMSNIFSFSEDEVVVHKELKLDIKLPYECDTFGTSDVIAVAGDVALMLDYKTGYSEIDDVDSNYQAKAYAIGVFQKFPEVSTTHSVFLIPQRSQELHGTFTRDQLPELEELIARVIISAKTVRPKWFIGTPELDELNPNGGCDYCLHKDKCPALGNAAFEIAARYDESWIPTGPVHSTEIDDPETLAKFYAVACIVQKWAEGIKHKAVSSGLAGLPPVGYKMRSMGATKKIVDGAGFLQIATTELAMDREELMAYADFPYAEIRDFFASKAERGKKTAYTKRFEEVLTDANVIEAGSERFTLVKEL